MLQFFVGVAQLLPFKMCIIKETGSNKLDNCKGQQLNSQH